MADYPAAAKLIINTDRIVRVSLARPKAYYSHAARQQLVVGMTDVRVNFTTPLKDNSYVIGSLVIANYADPLIDVMFIQAMVRSTQQQSGFDVILSAPPNSGNYWLHWAVAEEYNP